MINLIDKHADWLKHKLGYKSQLRFGIFLFYSSFLFFLWLPFSNEPPLIYIMSALALTLTGLGIIIAAEAAKEAADNNKE
jgi:hypothetical protein